MSRRKRIIDIIKAELEKILIVNSYKTDVGSSVAIEKENIDDGLTYLINIFEGDDNVIDDQRGSALISIHIELEIFSNISGDYVTRHEEKQKIISDIKKCIMQYRYNMTREISDISYPVSRRINKENGSNYLIVGMSFNIEYHERPGDPDY